MREPRQGVSRTCDESGGRFVHVHVHGNMCMHLRRERRPGKQLAEGFIDLCILVRILYSRAG